MMTESEALILSMKRMLPSLAALILVLAGCSPTGSISSGSPPASLPGDSPVPSSQQAESSTPFETGADPAVLLPEGLSIVVSGVTVKVDPMIEMLSIVQYLSDDYRGFGLITSVETSYQKDIDDAFAGWKDHPAVAFFNDAMQEGFSFDAPPTACLYLEKDFSISNNYEGSDFEANRMTVDLGEFRDVMKQFCVDTKFSEFFDAHRDFYQQMIEAYTGSFPQWDMIQAMEDYYGKSIGGYNIVLVPLFHPGGFGPSLSKPDGLHIFSIQGPYNREGDTPVFGDGEAIAELVLHEFGHSFLPITDSNVPSVQADIERSAYLIQPIQEKMNAMAYPQWSTAYEELVLRAVVIDLAVRNTGVDPKPALQAERDRGFIYIDDVYETVGRYSENREQYPVFDSFISVITDDLLEKYPSNGSK